VVTILSLIFIKKYSTTPWRSRMVPRVGGSRFAPYIRFTSRTNDYFCYTKSRWL